MRPLNVQNKNGRQHAVWRYGGGKDFDNISTIMNSNKYSGLKRLIISSALFFLFCFTSISQAIQNEIRPKIQNIVSKLKKETTLHLGGPVGLFGVLETNNKYYKLYEKLSTKATDKELVLLTNDNSKTIFLYSFLILYSRNYSALKEIFLKNIKDSSEVRIAGGCTGSADRVNTFMLRQLNPSYMNSRQPYMTQEEYNKYIKEFGETK